MGAQNYVWPQNDIFAPTHEVSRLQYLHSRLNFKRAQITSKLGFFKGSKSTKKTLTIELLVRLSSSFHFYPREFFFLETHLFGCFWPFSEAKVIFLGLKHKAVAPGIHHFFAIIQQIRAPQFGIYMVLIIHIFSSVSFGSLEWNSRITPPICLTQVTCPEGEEGETWNFHQTLC